VVAGPKYFSFSFLGTSVSVLAANLRLAAAQAGCSSPLRQSIARSQFPSFLTIKTTFSHRDLSQLALFALATDSFESGGSI
jgi:hypothetical protein